MQETHEVVTGKDDAGNKYVNQYRILCQLGRGSFGKVKLCVDTTSNRPFALKILNKGKMMKTRTSMGNAMQQVLLEVAIMKKLSHPDVVRLVEVIDAADAEKMYLVIEYVGKGPIYNYKPNGQCSVSRTTRACTSS